MPHRHLDLKSNQEGLATNTVPWHFQDLDSPVFSVTKRSFCSDATPGGNSWLSLSVTLSHMSCEPQNLGDHTPHAVQKNPSAQLLLALPSPLSSTPISSGLPAYLGIALIKVLESSLHFPRVWKKQLTNVPQNCRFKTLFNQFEF
jgi:hypothetical protein